MTELYIQVEIQKNIAIAKNAKQSYMRWKSKYRTDGEKRVIKKFLFLPKEIKGENRWLEFARIEQVYHESEDYTEYCGSEAYWEDVRFIN